MLTAKPLSIAYTPDSDDSFYYYALEYGKLPFTGYCPTFIPKPMSELNCDALSAKYDITAISSVLYPQIADDYAILSVGTSVGRGYGPVLVSKYPMKSKLENCKVGVPGIPTTGWFLLKSFFPDAVAIEMPFDEIAGAVAAGILDAGVMIHEELLYYPKKGLQCVMDLGAEWCKHHGLPLPVGLNVIRRKIKNKAKEQICQIIRNSLEYGLKNQQEVLNQINKLGRGVGGKCTESFVEMFANADSCMMPPDVRTALSVLFCQVVDLGISPNIPSIDIIEGCSEQLIVQRK